MRPTLSLIKREFTAYFFSPIGFVTLVAFLIVTGINFWTTVGLLTKPGPGGTEFPMQSMMGSDEYGLVFLFIFLLIPALLTMRLLAEERGTGTLESLMTAPIRDWQVVAGKYIACLMFFIVLWLPTVAYLPLILDLDSSWRPRNDLWPVVTSYLGAILAGAMFLSIGLFVSSLVKNQLVAAMIAMLLSLVFVVAAFWRPEYDAGSLTTKLVYFISVPEHFRRDFTRGILDTRHVVLYGTITFLCLFLTVRSLEARRLR